MPRSPTGRLGLVVFTLGIILLLTVFVLSYFLFASIARQLAEAERLPAESLPPLSRLLAAGAMRLGFLLVMGYVASLIAGRGLSLYGTSQEKDPE
jgi:tellurite resistance protein TehA-like permease